MSKYIANVLFHRLKGAKGWSMYSPENTLDVANIVNIHVNKRLFSIFDRDKPYTLWISYYNPEEEISPMFGIGINGYPTVGVYSKTKLYHDITARYSTKEEAENDMKDIMAKQEKLEKIQEQLRNSVTYGDYTKK